MSHICLLTPGLPPTNPRLFEEAEVLTQIWDDVHVVAEDYHWGHEENKEFRD